MSRAFGEVSVRAMWSRPYRSDRYLEVLGYLGWPHADEALQSNDRGFVEWKRAASPRPVGCSSSV